MGAMSNGQTPANGQHTSKRRAVGQATTARGKSRAERERYADVPVLPEPSAPDVQYLTPDMLAPVITAWKRALGVDPRPVFGTDIRGLVRNGSRRTGVSPVPRLQSRPTDGGNREHRYTITEAADILRAFASRWSQPDALLPDPFAGRDSGSIAARAPRPKRSAPMAGARKRAAARKATPAPEVTPSA